MSLAEINTVETAPPVAAAPAEGVDPALAMRRARDHLLGLQQPDGHWCAELEGDSILESEYILIKYILGQEDDPDLPLIVNHLRDLQQSHGGWSMFPGGDPELSGTVKAYFVLKLMGDDPDAAHMRAARKVIHEMGGAEKCNTFTRFFLACLGQISFDACPAIPPEVVLLPKWFYFNMYNVAAWTRTMILPLGIVTSTRFTREAPLSCDIAELYLDREEANRLGTPNEGIPTDWRSFFLHVDRFLKWYNRRPIEGLRKRAIAEAERWLYERHDDSEGLGAIFPPMVYMLVVFRILGYADDHPRVVKAHADLRDFFIQDGDRIRIQPCLSPVWDTGLSSHALAESGLSPEHPAAKAATRWLLNMECRKPVDWAEKVRGVEPSGWFFEYANPHYPDTDDTGMAVVTLKRLGGSECAGAIERGLNWLLAMQNDDGGWAAFDKTRDRPILEAIPFADHNAMQDPSCPDIAGRVMECLGHCGYTASHPAIQRAIQYLRRCQDPESGAWSGRWGVNYLYGTWQVLTGLRAVGADMDAGFVRKAVAWLRSVQHADGSFGETCESYADPSLKGIGEATASQTAWGAMGLMAGVGAHDPDVQRAVQWLADTQREDGGWNEEPFTGTGFPKVFYLRYHMYRIYFPLTALARYERLCLRTIY